MYVAIAPTSSVFPIFRPMTSRTSANCRLAPLSILFRTPRDIMRMIRDNDEEWKEYVPEVAFRMAEHLKEGNN